MLPASAFATVDASYHEAPAASGADYACRYPHLIEPGWPYAFGGNLPMCTLVDYPSKRTEYVQAGPADWQFTARSENETDNPAYEDVDRDEGTLKAGSHLTESPFSGPLAPCAQPLAKPLVPGEPTYSAARNGDTVTLELAQLCGPDLTSIVASSSGDYPDVEIYQDGTLIADGTNYVGVAPGSHILRIVADVTRDNRGDARTSTHSTTDWTIHSSTTTADSALPLPQLAFDLPTNLTNNALPGRNTLRIHPTHQTGAPALPFTTLTLTASFDDGATWHNVPVTRDGGTWRAEMPTAPAGGFASLRASATDSAGNSITETVIRAYGAADRH